MHITYIYQFIIKGITKDTNAQTGGGMHRARDVRRGPEFHALPGRTINQKLSEPWSPETFMEAASHRHDG